REPPPGFRVTVFGLETELGSGTVEAALALCRAHRLAVRASRVRLKSLEDLVLDALDDDTARRLRFPPHEPPPLQHADAAGGAVRAARAAAGYDVHLRPYGVELRTHRELPDVPVRGP